MISSDKTPEADLGTLAEVHGELVHVRNECSEAFRLVANNNTPLYPSIHFEPLQPSVPDYINTCYDAPNIVEATLADIKTTAEKQWDEKFPIIEATPAYKNAEKLYNWFSSTFAPTVTNNDTFKELFTHPFKAMAWHPHVDMLALAHDDNQVYIYQKSSDSISWSCKVLAHDLMKDITCIAWKSKAEGLLAVGCANGSVCVWTIPAVPQVADQQPTYHPTATMRHLTYKERHDVSSLTWDPTPGSHLLAVTSVHSSVLAIHDLLLDRTIPLKRYGKGTVLLRWSPNGQWLFEGGAGGYARMWDTRTWISKKLNTPAGLWVQAACWAPDNRTLLYSMWRKTDIHGLFLAGGSLDNINSINPVSLPARMIQSIGGVDSKVDGAIRHLCIDTRNGQRLAVAFEHSDLIAMYTIKQVSPLKLNEQDMLHKIGYIRGANTVYGSHVYDIEVSAIKNARPLHISFSETYKNGALLATAWDNGTVTFVTQSFLTDEEVKKRFII